MKTSMKLLCLLLAVSMLLVCMAGCASKSATTDTAASGSAAASASASAAASGSSASGATLLIGGIGALTGDYANYGTSNRNGADLAVKEINAAGGVNGMTLALDFQDSQADPDSAVNAYGKQIDSGMKVSLGATFSGETTSVVAAAKDDGILILTPTASADKVIQGNDAAFRVCFTDSSQGTASADYISDNSLADKVAVFYQSDIDYSVGLYKAFDAECQAKGIEITEVQTFTKDTSTDFSHQISAIRLPAPSSFHADLRGRTSTFLTQANGKFGQRRAVFRLRRSRRQLTKISDSKYCENVMMLTPFCCRPPTMKTFRRSSRPIRMLRAVPDQLQPTATTLSIPSRLLSSRPRSRIRTTRISTASWLSQTQITVKGVTGEMTWDASGETPRLQRLWIIHAALPFCTKANKLYTT